MTCRVFLWHVILMVSCACNTIHKQDNVILHANDAQIETIPETTIDSVTCEDTNKSVEVSSECDKSTQRIVLVVGDSQACVVAPHIFKVKKSSDVVFVECKSGTRVSYWSSGGAFEKAINNRSPTPDTVIVFLGTNDYEAQTCPDTSKMLGLMREKNVNCVWVGNTAIRNKKWHINEMLKRVVSFDCTYFDTEVADIFLFDTIHPSPYEAERWIKAVWELIPPKQSQCD